MEDKLHPSATMHHPDAKPFLQAVTAAEDIFNSIIAVAAPDMFTCGSKAILALKDMDLCPNSRIWPSIFSGMAVIANRRTPVHWDKGGSIWNSDLLISGGDHRNAEFHIPDIDVVLSYDPGTGVLLTGSVLAHSVPMTWSGSRLCLAHFMKDAVQNRLGVPRPSPTNLFHYDRFKSPGYLLRVDGRTVS